MEIRKKKFFFYTKGNNSNLNKLHVSEVDLFSTQPIWFFFLSLTDYLASNSQ